VASTAQHRKDRSSGHTILAPEKLGGNLRCVSTINVWRSSKPRSTSVRLDRTLSFKQHLEEVKAKVTSRVALIRRLAGTTWGACAKTRRLSTQALVFSAAEYYAPAWSRSPHASK
ncbi:hypothetical protein JOQ06_007827, partial [Pogonophryne albipinna]